MINLLDKVLIPEWRQAYKFLSVQAWSLAMALIAAWGLMPDALRALLPNKLDTVVAVSVFVLAAFGTLGRVVQQPGVSQAAGNQKNPQQGS